MTLSNYIMKNKSNSYVLELKNIKKINLAKSRYISGYQNRKLKGAVGGELPNEIL